MTVGGKTLTVTAGKASDRFALRVDPAQSRSTFKQIEVDAGRGDDRDTVEGGPGDDVLEGGGGVDTIKGDLQTDLATIPGGAEPDDRPDAVTANGTDDSESVFVSGSARHGTVVGGPGYDIFFGGDGSDVLFGGPGNDVLVGGGGGDDIIGQD